MRKVAREPDGSRIGGGRASKWENMDRLEISKARNMMALTLAKRRDHILELFLNYI